MHPAYSPSLLSQTYAKNILPSEPPFSPVTEKYAPAEIASTEVSPTSPVAATPPVSPTIPAVPALPLDTLATENGMIKTAAVNYDPVKQEWSAKWQKPPMFTFGMILRPALISKMKQGESFSFEIAGQQGILSKNSSNQLIFEAAGQSTEISSKNLGRILNRGITANGINLTIDRSGNLVMKAIGEHASRMAHLDKSS